MSRKERERLMVFARIKSKELSRREGGEVLGLSLRQMHRMYKRFVVHGDVGLLHRSRGGASPRRIDAGEKARALELFRNVYRGFGPTLAAEKLAELHGIDLACETLRQWMIVADLWKDRRARLKPVHQPRHRRDCVGELIQIDGSEHWWFETRGP